MAVIRPSVSPPRRPGNPGAVRSSRSDPGESVPALNTRQGLGLEVVCTLLQRRRNIRTRTELIEWRRQFRETVELLRKDAEHGTSGTR